MPKRGNGEGSIYKRSDGKWVASISLEGGGRKVFYGKTKKEVTDKLVKVRAEQQQGTLVSAKDQTVKEYLENWLENVQRPKVRISTYVKYQKLMNRYIIPDLGKISLQKLTPQRVQALYTKRFDAGLKPKTVMSIHGLLHKALDNAVKWNLIIRNVCDAVTPPRVPKTEKQVLPVSQARLLLEHVKQNRLETLLALAITTGMRRGEILALRWSDVDLVEGNLQIKRTVDYIPHYGYVESEPKTATGRRKVMLAPFVVEMLNAHRAKQMEDRYKVGDKWVDKNLVFCGLEGNFFNPNYLLRVFKKVLIASGLPHMHFHDLRHSAATILLSMNVHPKVVQELLGHSSITITMDLYSHVLPSMQQEVIDKMGDAFQLLGNIVEEKSEKGIPDGSENDDDGMAGAGVPIIPKK